MARVGSTNTANHLLRTAAVVTATPFTISAWYKAIDIPSNDGNNHAILTLTDTGTNDNFFSISGRSADDLFELAINAGAGQQSAVSSTVAVADVWHHICGVSASATDRRIYVDAVDEDQNTVDIQPTSIDTTALFIASISAGFFSPANAVLAECGIWNVALSANEVAALARGLLPNQVRPLALQGYYQLPEHNAGSEPDLSGNGNGLTEAGTIGVANHAPVVPYSVRFWGRGGPLIEVAAAGRIMSSLTAHGGLAGYGGIAGKGGGLAA